MASLTGSTEEDIAAFALIALTEYEERLNSKVLRPLPKFIVEETGEPPLIHLDSLHSHKTWTNSSFSQYSSRFGVQVDENCLILNRALELIFEGLVRREILSLFVSTKFLTDLTYDIINWDCYFYLDVPAAELWVEMVKGAAKQYTTEHAFSPTSFNSLMNVGQSVMNTFFQAILGKLILFDPVIPEEVAGDTVIFLAHSLGTQREIFTYTPEDVAFAHFLFKYFVRERMHPDFARLKESSSPFSDESLKNLINRFDALPLSPSCFYNPSVIGAELSYILFEVPPTMSPYGIRQLTFLPHFSIGISQLLGCPQLTYLGQYILPPQNLEEFRRHLNILKKQNILLDYHIFRAKAGQELINLNNTFAVQLKSKSMNPTVLEIYMSYQEEFSRDQRLAAAWKQSWLIQQMLPLFMLRHTGGGTLTNLDHARNIEAFRGLMIGIIARFKPLKREDIAIVLPILEKFRNVLYVVHLIDIALKLAKRFSELHLRTVEEINQSMPMDVGGSAWIWTQFPEKTWLSQIYNEFLKENGGEGAFLSELEAAHDTLELFLPYIIPTGQNPLDFLRTTRNQIWNIVGQSIKSVPRGPRAMRKYFEQLYDEILQSKLVQPRASLTILPRENVDDFFFIANKCHPFAKVCDFFRQTLTSDVTVAYISQCSDESGEEYVLGMIKTTLEKYRTIRKKLVGSNSVLGPEAGIVATRRVTYWDDVHRNFTQTFDYLTQDFASISEYLDLLRQEFFAQWVPRQKISVPSYSRTVLEDVFSGLIDRRVTPPKQTLKLTPELAVKLKTSYFSGDPPLHTFIKQRLKGHTVLELNWPKYGLDRYLLQVFLSARNPQYIFENLITPATRRVLTSTTVLGFQTAFIEYLWPKDSPDDRFLRYVQSRTERNVLSYSLHKVKAETRFFNLDRIRWLEASEPIDALDMQIMLLAQPPGLARLCTIRLPYGGEVEHYPGSSAYREAQDAFSNHRTPTSFPPTGRALFTFDPRPVGLQEKIAIIARGEFDAVPLCLALPLGQYFETEEIYYSSTEKLVNQIGHIIFFDFPQADLMHLYNFLDDIIRGRTARPLTLYSGLIEQNLTAIDGVNLTSINPLQANPFDTTNQRFYHLPKRRRVAGGSWHTFSLSEQVQELQMLWNS